ncbi:MAG: hypothetical protein EHM19_01095 [Candidatus Latescibacterota bacterium]|nr:MAG: hypothetical protein EHM19_01095 [Candidatus Latescibacterota bacterium]
MSPKLSIHIYSFSYHGSGPPSDPTGHGGGFVFDCRSLPNPGREERHRELTGKDGEVARFLNGRREAEEFWERVHGLVSAAAEAFATRGFTDLTVAFGCTGGRHRSVYFAERLARALEGSGYACEVIHRDLPGEGG